MIERVGDIFQSEELALGKAKLLHCISADYQMAKGIAALVEKKYHVRASLLAYGTNKYPDCLMVNQVINMVTKQNYWSKPTYKSFHEALKLVSQLCIENNITMLVMPKIGCGLDRLDWSTCKQYIQEELDNAGIECIIYYLNN